MSVAEGRAYALVADISAHMTSWQVPTTAVGLGCIATLVLVERTRLRAHADIVDVRQGNRCELQQEPSKRFG